MINSLSFLKRKVFFEPLVSFTANDPMYENIDAYLADKFNSRDEKTIAQKQQFLKNIKAIHRSMVNPGDADLRTFLYISTPLWILAGIFFIYIFTSDIANSMDAAGPFILFAVIFLIIKPFYVAYKFISGFNELKSMEKRLLETSIFLDKKNYPAIWKPIDELSAKIGVDTGRIKILYVKENHFIPTVTDLKRIGTQLIVITIPRNLLLLSSKNPAMYQAIMAHELSHLTQGDSGIWMYYYMDFRCAYNLRDFILNLVQGKEERLKKKYKAFNSSAEYLADLGSIILTEDFKIFEFLEGSYIANVDWGFHPSSTERIHFLKAFLYKQAKAAFR